MPELRWVLLALGVLLVLGVYLWGRGTFARNRGTRSAPRPRRRRAEPHISTEPEFDADDVLLSPPGRSEALDTRHTEPKPGTDGDEASTSHAFEREPVQGELEPEPEPEEPPRVRQPTSPTADAPEKIVAVRFVPKGGQLDGQDTVLALREAGLRHGRYGIFHRHDEDGSDDEPAFSVASLTEPGSFDLQNLSEKPIAGMSFFMVLPARGDPVARFDDMMETARSLAHDLDAELFDDAGSSWSIQRERYVREELIQYRHQFMQY